MLPTKRKPSLPLSRSFPCQFLQWISIDFLFITLPSYLYLNYSVGEIESVCLRGHIWRISRLMVEGAWPKRVAITLIDCVAANSREISSRSAKLKASLERFLTAGLSSKGFLDVIGSYIESQGHNHIFV